MKTDKAKHGNLTENTRQKWAERKFKSSKYICYSHMLQP